MVRIAHWTLGEGEPLVVLPALHFGHLRQSGSCSRRALLECAVAPADSGAIRRAHGDVRSAGRGLVIQACAGPIGGCGRDRIEPMCALRELRRGRGGDILPVRNPDRVSAWCSGRRLSVASAPGEWTAQSLRQLVRLHFSTYTDDDVCPAGRTENPVGERFSNTCAPA
jgi:hypothetical protein